MIQGLTRAQARTLSLIVEYLKSSGRRCFNYNSINRYWAHSDVRINSSTFERKIRELASLGLLERVEYRDERGRRRIAFCLRRDLYESVVGGGD